MFTVGSDSVVTKIIYTLILARLNFAIWYKHKFKYFVNEKTIFADEHKTKPYN